MAKERHVRALEISNVPELLRLVEQLGKSDEPLVLRKETEDVAIVRPLKRTVKRSTRGGVLTRDDALFKLVGAGESQIPGGVSGKKHEHFLAGYRQRHT